MRVCIRCGRNAGFIARRFNTDEAICSECLRLQLPNLPLLALTENLTSNKATVNRCPNCGTLAEDAKASGLVGCPLCYEVMDDAAWRHFGITRGSWSKTPVE